MNNEEQSKVEFKRSRRWRQARVDVAFSEDLIGDLLHISISNDAINHFQKEVSVIVSIAKGKFRNLIAEEVDRVYADRIEAEIKSQMKQRRG